MTRSRFNRDSRQLELFTILANTSGDVRSKSVRELMSFNTFNISSRKKNVIEHAQGDKFLNVQSTTGNGVATQHDADIIIFLVSHIVEALNQGQNVSNRINFTGYEFCKFTGRFSGNELGGIRYKQIWDSMIRLQDTFVHTNINLADGTNEEHRWNFLSDIKKITSASGKSLYYEVSLADTIFKAITSSTPAVLTLDDRYFSLRSGFDKWLYQFMRRTAGTSKEWIVSEKLIHSRSGSSLDLSQFRRRLLEDLYESRELLDYKISKAMIGSEKSIAFERKKFVSAIQRKSTIVME